MQMNYYIIFPVVSQEILLLATFCFLYTLLNASLELTTMSHVPSVLDPLYNIMKNKNVMYFVLSLF